MNQEKETVVQRQLLKRWHSLRVISGKEKKIQNDSCFEIERPAEGYCFSVVVPTEKYKNKKWQKLCKNATCCQDIF
jgi:hypothetical protein